jgi:hypothetical protein
MSENDWFTKDRSETASNRMPDVERNGLLVSNPALGVNVYNNAVSAEQCDAIIETLERELGKSAPYYWQGAKVTNSESVDTSARNAVDFKISSKNLGPRGEHNAALYDAHEALFQRIRACVDDYGRYWGYSARYYEAFNFVKYEGAGTHFKIHADHGPTYVCTVSVVVYLNDDYEGGELFFPRLDGLAIKPKKGDIVVSPSTYIYEHASQDMISGTKYAVVVMTDYNDRSGVNQRMSPVIEDYPLQY